MIQNIPRHKVFISFHHEDSYFRDRFAKVMDGDIVDKSVRDGDIDGNNMNVMAIRQKIRDNFIRDATVTVVLIGPRTWQRKHVDWEIGSSLRRTKYNSRCGLMGILLPNHPDYGRSTYDPHKIPPKLADNCDGEDPFASVYDWPKRKVAAKIRGWVHLAFERRRGTSPNNSRPQFRRNRSSDYRKGWTN